MPVIIKRKAIENACELHLTTGITYCFVVIKDLGGLLNATLGSLSSYLSRHQSVNISSSSYKSSN